MRSPNQQRFLWISLTGHGLILLALIISFEFSDPMAVIENTNQQDVISAVVLGDTAKSKILPQDQPPPAPPVQQAEPKPQPPAPAPAPKPAVAAAAPAEKAIALQVDKKKPKPTPKKLSPDIFGKDLLADVQAQTQKVKQKTKAQQKALASQFQKMLKTQSEASLRDHLLDENIKLQGQQSRQAQGVVDKYKALIIQAISEKWLVPPQSNKKLVSELLIRLAPGGMVLSVDVTKSSGDPALDSSARAAVLKASPLPVPNDSGAFEPFRQFVLKVKPENVIET